MIEYTIDSNFWECYIRGEGRCALLFDKLLQDEDTVIALDYDHVIEDEYEQLGITSNGETSGILEYLDSQKRVMRSYDYRIINVVQAIRMLPVQQRPRARDRAFVCVASQTTTRYIASNDNHICNGA